MKLSQLKPNPKNPRKISDKKLEMLRKSLNEFGDLSGIVFNKQTGHLVGGHQRLKAIPKDAEIVMDTETHGHVKIGNERFQYREVSWDETKEKAANIAANKGAGEWDIPQLTEWFLDLDTLNVDMDLTMWDADERENLIVPVTKLDAVEGEDVVPSFPVEPKTKRGDIYQLGKHRLMCGDSTSIGDVETLMDGYMADITFTSPPYNAGCFGYDDGKDKYKGNSDNRSQDDYFDFLCEFTNICLDVSSYTFINNQFLSGNRHALGRFFGNYNNFIKEVFPWIKNTAPPNVNPGVFTNRFEFFLCLEKDNKKKGFPASWQGKFHNVIEGHTAAKDNVTDGSHSATMPVYVPDWFLERLEFAKVIYEPFGGSGTTMIACEKWGRRCFSMELDPHYCDVIVARWEKFTGNKAELLTHNSGKTEEHD